MKILFDFLAIYQKNGAVEYTRRVFYALLDRIEHAAHTDDITITCLFDSHHLPAYTEMRPDSLRHKYVDFVDIQMASLQSMHRIMMYSSSGVRKMQDGILSWKN